MLSSMHLALTSILLLHQPTAAQTPPSFTPSCDQNLGIRWSHDVFIVKPGQSFLASDTSTEPSLSAGGDVLEAGEQYLLVMIDPDVQFPGQPRTTILHWSQPSFQYDDTALVLVPTAGRGSEDRASYAGPHPPAGQNHRYILMLFVQPDGYRIPEDFKSFIPPDIPHRLGFNVTKFMEAAGLGAPVVANYFTVQGPALSVGDELRRKVRSWLGLMLY